MNRIQHPLILEGKRVKLAPLDSSDFAEVAPLANNARIWEFMSINGTDSMALILDMRSSLLKRMAGEQYPFTVTDKQTGKIIGCTMFHSISPEHRRLEIGWTWYDPGYWRTGYNHECKLLQLTHCFEILKTVRVQFQTDENNHRSRAAILGIGAKMEGVLRKERIRNDGTFRNTVMYSITDEDWPSVKKLLEKSVNR